MFIINGDDDWWKQSAWKVWEINLEAGSWCTCSYTSRVATQTSYREYLILAGGSSGFVVRSWWNIETEGWNIRQK